MVISAKHYEPFKHLPLLFIRTRTYPQNNYFLSEDDAKHAQNSHDKTTLRSLYLFNKMCRVGRGTKYSYIILNVWSLSYHNNFGIPASTMHMSYELSALKERLKVMKTESCWAVTELSHLQTTCFSPVSSSLSTTRAFLANLRSLNWRPDWSVQTAVE